MIPITPSNELKQATRDYLQSLAKAETLKPICEQIQAVVLAELKCCYDPKWSEHSRRNHLTGPITDPKHSYLMSDEDAARYYPALDAAYRAAGFDLPDEIGYCPYLMADHERIKAENRMLDAAVCLHGHDDLKPPHIYGENRKKLVDLTCRYVVNFIS